MPTHKAIGIRELTELALAEEARVYIKHAPWRLAHAYIGGCTAPRLCQTLRAISALAQAVNEFAEH